MTLPSPATSAMERPVGTNHENVVRDFKAMLKKWTVLGTCKRQFVLVAKLTSWMKEPGPGCHNRRTGCLLQAAYSRRNEPGLPIEADHIAQGGQSALLTFCILLELDLGRLIHIFHSHELVDRKLPIDQHQLCEKLEVLDDLPEPAEQLAMKFNEKQWRYCAATFDLRMGREYVSHKILPIRVKRKINKKGATADLWYIEVHEEFVTKRLRDAVPDSRFSLEGPDGELGYVSHKLHMEAFLQSILI